MGVFCSSFLSCSFSRRIGILFIYKNRHTDTENAQLPHDTTISSQCVRAGARHLGGSWGSRRPARAFSADGRWRRPAAGPTGPDPVRTVAKKIAKRRPIAVKGGEYFLKRFLPRNFDTLDSSSLLLSQVIKMLL